MLFKFIGTYSNGRTFMRSCGVTFNGREPSDVTDADGIRRLSGHPEFEAVADSPQVIAEPKRRGRPPKKG